MELPEPIVKVEFRKVAGGWAIFAKQDHLEHLPAQPLSEGIGVCITKTLQQIGEIRSNTVHLYEHTFGVKLTKSVWRQVMEKL